MKKESLALHHKSLITKALKNVDVALSEYSFANLYLFRKKHQYQLIQDGGLFIQGITYDGVRHVMPLGLPQNVLPAKEDDCIYPIPEVWLSYFDETKYQKVWKEQDSDYLYDVARLASYKGRDLSKKRNLEKQFLEQYESHSAPLTKTNCEDALKVLEGWQDQDEADIAECKEALTLIEELELSGLIVYADSTPVAFILGEEVSRDVFVAHFAKADITYKGVYQHLYHLFAKTLEGRFSLLNLEQDLGNANIKKAKHSYHPVAMAKKWRLVRRSAGGF